MKLILLAVSKTDNNYIEEGVALYTSRIRHYIPFEFLEIPEDKTWKKLSPQARRKAEGEAILSRLAPGDKCILLDEKGRTFSSEAFAERLGKLMAAGPRRIVYIIGGAYGFSEEVYHAVDDRLSLSEMTFSHQMVRLFFTEQLYRAFTILRNEPYHNR